MSLVRAVRRAADQTPEDRNRHVDLLRAFAICVVVIGHWLAVVVTTNGEIEGSNALSYLSWSHPVTWILQVMPLFFLVGGYANGASLDSHKRRGGDAFGWLLNRSARLLAPTTTFLILLSAAGLAARSLGVDQDLVAMAIWAASIPLWFLAAYLSLVFLAPALHVAHRRFGLAVPAVVTAAVLLFDVARLGLDIPVVGQANYLLVWLVFHQIGFAWRDGTLALPAAVYGGLAVGGALILMALTTAGPYPVSMVGVPGEELQNTAPPTFALLILGLTQCATALLINGPVNRLLRRAGPWTAVVAVNAVVLTLFLWHMAAAVFAATAMYPTGVLPQPEVDSAEWLWWRLPWLAVCAVILAILTSVFAGIETRSGGVGRGHAMTEARLLARIRTSKGMWRATALAGMTGVVVGLLMIALADRDYEGVGGIPVTAMIAYLTGAGLLRLARHRQFSSH